MSEEELDENLILAIEKISKGNTTEERRKIFQKLSDKERNSIKEEYSLNSAKYGYDVFLNQYTDSEGNEAYYFAIQRIDVLEIYKNDNEAVTYALKNDDINDLFNTFIASQNEESKEKIRKQIKTLYNNIEKYNLNCSLNIESENVATKIKDQFYLHGYINLKLIKDEKELFQ